MSDCSICYEALNKSNHARIECVKQCDIVCCRTCVEKYVVSCAPHEATCMGCKEEWSVDYLETQMTKRFMTKEVAPITKQRLFEREEMRFPETQDVIVQRRNYKKGWECYVKGRKKRILMNRIQMRVTASDWRQYFEANPEILIEKLNDIATLGAEVSALYAEYNKYCTTPPRATVQTRFVQRCTREPCRGFLTADWKCGICDLSSCSKCHEPKDEDHQCDKGKIETVKLLAKDSKSCPKCACLITKIEGCDHMWCTNCNTGFSWKKGTVLDDRQQTNPLYYEYMRRTTGSVPRALGDTGGPCGGEEDFDFGSLTMRTFEISNSIMAYCPTMPDGDAVRKHQFAAKRLEMYCEVLRHIHYVESTRPLFDPNFVQDNEDLRIRYLQDDMPKKAFQQTLKSRENTSKGRRAMSNILDTFKTVAKERIVQIHMLRRTGYDRLYIESVTNIVEELDSIAKFTNDMFAANAKVFGKRMTFQFRFAIKDFCITLGLHDNLSSRYVAAADYGVFEGWETQCAIAV